jgi:hypothetical protein
MTDAPTHGAALMTPDQIINDVETIADDLARLRTGIDRVAARLLGRLADTELQLEDVRSERDKEHQLAESLKAKLANSERLAASLQTAIANSVAIEKAAGIIAGKTGMGITEAKARLRSHARDRRETIESVADRLVAAQDPATRRHGAGEAERIITSAGIPLDFWNALTLDGAVFE